MLNKIKKLLQSLDDVNVIDMQDSINYPSIILTISSIDSIVLLTYCSEAANISFTNWSRHHPCSKEAIENPYIAIEYQFRGKDIDTFKNLGAFIVWNLYDLKKILKSPDFALKKT